MTDDAEDWARVLQGAGSDAGNAFGRVFDRRKDEVRRQVRRLLDDPADVEDAIAAVFLEAWRRRRAAKLVEGSLLPWLLATALNVARNSSRNRRRYEGFLAGLPAARSARDPGSVAEDRQVLRVLRTLPIRDQQVLTLCVLEGWPERDAAAVLGVPSGTVKSRLHRAKQKLAQQLEGTVGVEPGTGVRNGI